MTGCVVLMIDESAAMQAPAAKAPGAPMTSLGGAAKTKAESVATAINALLNRLTQEVDCEVALIGYRTDAAGQADVGCRWSGALSGCQWVPVGDLKGAEVTVEQRVRKIPGPGGFLQEQPFDFPVWYQPQLGERSPQIAALQYCRQLLEAWGARPDATTAPLVIHLFAGSSADGNPLKATKDVMDLQTPGGSPLVIQVHLSSSDTVPATLYPSNRAFLPVGPTRDLFERASLLPDHLAAALRAAKVALNPKARGMIYHAKMEDVSRALNLVSAHLKPGAAASVAAAPTARPLPPAALAAAAGAAASAPVPMPAAPAAAAASESFAPPPEDSAAASVDLAPTPLPEEAAPAPDAFPPLPEETSPVGDASVPPMMEETWPVSDSGPAPAPEEVAASLDASSPPAVSEPALNAVTPDQPVLVLCVLDRSVDDPFSGNLHNVCQRLQTQLGDLLEQIVKFGGGAIDVGVVSYGMDGQGEAEVRTTLEGGLAMRTFARDNELEANAVRIDECTEEVPNGVGGLIAIPHRRPVLVEVEPTSAASAVPAFAEVSRLVAEWCGEHPAAGGPPLVFHLTRGQLDPADAEAAVAQLTGLQASVGVAPLLYHLVETESNHAVVVCPGEESQLADPLLQCLWRLTSPLLGRGELAAEKPSFSAQARGMVVNGKPNLLLDALRRACS
jgi:hypothetical protein